MPPGPRVCRQFGVTPRLQGLAAVRTPLYLLTYHFIPAPFRSIPREESVSSHQFAYPQKRRSTRIGQAIPLLVQGVGALREPYQEQVSTLSISCHGCAYQSKHEVIQGETVYLDIKPPATGAAGCSSKARVKWAQKLNGKDRIFQIAVELENAGNVWGIDSPPADWFPTKYSEAAEPAVAGR